MRISDWSSDVCSSDLKELLVALLADHEVDVGGLFEAVAAIELLRARVVRIDRELDFIRAVQARFLQRPVHQPRTDALTGGFGIGVELLELDHLPPARMLGPATGHHQLAIAQPRAEIGRASSRERACPYV